MGHIRVRSDLNVTSTHRQDSPPEVAALPAATYEGTPPDAMLGFEECYRRTFDSLVRTAYLQTLSLHVAQELVQDSFANMHEKWSRVTNPDAYVRRSVVNACTSYRLRERRIVVGLEGTDEPTAVDAEPDEMFEMMRSLPKKQRMALVLRYHEDQSEAAIAEKMGCSVPTVATLIRRGLIALRSEMEQQP